MSDALKTVLGFEAAGAISTLSSLVLKLDAYSTSMGRAATATRTFNKSAATTDAAIKGLAKKVNAQATAAKKAGTSTRSAAAATDKLAASTKKATKSANEMVLSWKSVTRIFAIQVIHQAISKIISSFGSATQAARDYEIALGEIQTIGGKAFQGSMDALAAQTEAFAASHVQDLPAVTEGLYQTLSNQVTDAAHAFEFLSTAADFSVAAVTDLDSSVNLLSSVINSYGMEASAAEEVSGKLFKTIELGRIRGEEFANTFGRVAKLAAQLGISLDETLASLATLTVSGLKYNEAFTLMTNVQLKLIKPTKALKERYAELGVATAEAGIAAYTYQGFLEKVMENTDGSATAIGEMFSRVRAIRGVLGQAGEAAELYAANLIKIQAASAQTLIDAKAFIFDTNAKQLELEFSRLNIEMVKMGRVANDVGLAVMRAMGGAPEALTAITVGLATVGVAWAVLKTHAIASITAQITGMGALRAAQLALIKTSVLLAASPLAAAIAIGAGIAAAIVLYNHYSNAVERADEAIKMSGERRLKATLRNLAKESKAEREVLDAKIRAMLQNEFLRNKDEQAARGAAAAVRDLSFDSIGKQLSSQVGAANSFFDAIINKAKEAKSIIEGLQATIRGMAASLSDWNFDRAIKGMSDVGKAQAHMKRATQLQQASQRAYADGEYEIADSLAARARAEAQAGVVSADTTKDKQLIAKTEKQYNKIAKAGIAQKKQQIQLTKQQAALAAKATPHMIAAQADLNQKTKEYNDLKSKQEETTMGTEARAAIDARVKEAAARLGAAKQEAAQMAEFAPLFGLKEDFAAEMKGLFDPVTGEVKTFEVAISDAIDRVDAKFNSFASNAEARLSAITDGLTLGETSAERQSEMTEWAGILDGVAAAKAVLAKAKSDIETETARAPGLATGVAQAGGIRPSTQDLVSQGFGSEAMQKAQRFNEIMAIQHKLLKAGAADTQAYADNMAYLTKEVAEATREQEEKGGIEAALSPDIATPMQESLDSLTKLSDAFANMEKAANDVKVGDKLKASLETVKPTAAEVQLEVGPKMQAAATVGAAGMKNLGDAGVANANRAKAAWAAANAVAAGGGGGGTVNAANGGLIYRAGGGFVPRGTDTVPAMLTPGEFVMNAGASKKFYSQLIAMNSGREPIYRENGGSVTTVGDVNINVTETQSARATAREVAAEIRRGIGRKTIRNF